MVRISHVELFSHQGYKSPGQVNAGNEDNMVYAGQTLAVVDGATAVVKDEIQGMNTAAYTAHYVHDHLTRLALLPEHKDAEAHLLLAGLNRAFGQHIEAEYPQIAALGTDGPCASAVVVRLHEDSYSFGVIGDCCVAELGLDGNWFVAPWELHDEEEQRLQRAKEMLTSKNLPLNTMRNDPDVLADIRAARKRLNVDRGVFNGDPAMENFLLYGRRPLAGVKELLLFSDGMGLPGVDKVTGAKHAAMQMTENGCSAYWRGLKAVYDGDPEFTRFLRYKHMDDATAIRISFAPLMN